MRKAASRSPIPSSTATRSPVRSRRTERRSSCSRRRSTARASSAAPPTDALEQIAKTGPKDADYIHVEIWKDFGAHVVNRAAADWVFRNGDLTEPWLYLIAPNGMIVDRWGPLFDPAQVAAELDKVAG